MASKKVISFVLTFISLVLLDYIVISTIILPLYQSNLSEILRQDMKIIPSLITWLIITLGISYFVTPNSKTNKDSFIHGLLFGLVIYGVFDLTNYAILSQWTIKIVLIDVIWGMLLCGILGLINKSLIK